MGGCYTSSLKTDQICINEPDSYGCWICDNDGNYNYQKNSGSDIKGTDLCELCNKDENTGIKIQTEIANITGTELTCNRIVGSKNTNDGIGVEQTEKTIKCILIKGEKNC
ncbi:hypothetical protein GF362_00905 [Candidatus Dojkabacteria bacterium]|nr:hypothetical protein [Candidatus Dojkabacteria bacterium]